LKGGWSPHDRKIPLRIRFPEIRARNPGRDAKEQVGMTIIKRDSAGMGHFHVCDDSAAPCDDPEDQMVVAIGREGSEFTGGTVRGPVRTGPLRA
jgi:hypothetical protein